MASAIEPVYNGTTGNGTFLEGVVGVDITVATLVDQVLALSIPWHGYGVLIGRTGTIMALPHEGERDFNLTELKDHDYQSAILQDTFKPESFNLFNRADLGSLSPLLESQMDGIVAVDLNGQMKQAAWGTVNETGWKLLVIVSDEHIDEQVLALTARISMILYIMVSFIVVFYVGFFLYLWYKAKDMSRAIAQPLTNINNTVKQIGQGNYEQEAKPVAVVELDETARGVVEMGRRLGEERAALLQTQDELRKAKEMAESAAKAKTEVRIARFSLFFFC